MLSNRLPFSDSQWSRLESLIQRLEEQWQLGDAPDLDELLEQVPPTDRQKITLECVKVDMECRWRTGQSVQVESYLTKWPELLSDDSVITELLQSECYTRVLYASPPTGDELRRRFPRLAERIDLEEITDAALIDRADLFATDETTAQELASDTNPETDESPPLVLLGEQLGRYQIISKIGTGGQGDVYRAVDNRLKRDMALKLLRNPDARLLERFIREPQFAASIQHRSICKIFDAGTIHGMHYIAMELIEGETVQQRLQSDGPFDQREAATIAAQTAAALSQVHATGIVHRDIKSGNIMIDREGVPVLMDFGLARPTSSCQGMTTTEGFGGTLAFMSPEQAGGYISDHRSDVYSLGVVIYQMLTGELPFSLLPAEFFKQIGKSHPPRPIKVRPDLDRDLDTICRMAMARMPEDRYQSADEMADALERYLAGRSQTVTPSRSGRLRWGLVAATAAVLMVIAGVAFWNSGWRNDSDLAERTGQIPTETDPLQQLEPRRVDRWIETDFSVMSYAADVEANRLFIADGQGKKSYPIREFDLASGLEVGEPIPFDDLHMHKSLQLSLDRRYLYATNFYFEYISRIDLEGSREPESIRIIDEEKERGDAWRWDNGMALTSDGTLAVVLMGNDGRPVDPEGICNDQLSIVDLSQEPPKLLVEVPLQDEPRNVHVEIPGDEDAAYVATSPRPMTDVPAVYRVALRPPYAQQKFAIPDGTPKDVVVSSRLNRVFIADEGHRRIWVVDRSEFGAAQPEKFWTLGQRAPRALALNESRQLLAVVCMASRSLHLLDSVTGHELARYEKLRHGCDMPTFIDNGQRLLLNANSPEGGVAVVDVPAFETRVAFTSDRAGGTDQIYTMKPDGTDLRPLFSTPSYADDLFPRWSPHGDQIAFVTDRNPQCDVAVVRADGTQLRVFESTTPAMIQGPEWSPDGKCLAYVTADQVGIHLLDLQSGAVSEIPCDLLAMSNEIHTVCWETEETLIIVAQPIRNALKREIYRLNVTTGQTTALTNEQELESSCRRSVVSRDGRIATQRDLVRDGPSAGIYLLHEQGPREEMFEELTLDGPPLIFRSGYRWFPNGDRMIFSAMEEGDSFDDLYILDIETKSYRKLTSGDWNDRGPDVSPPLPDAWLQRE